MLQERRTSHYFFGADNEGFGHLQPTHNLIRGKKNQKPDKLQKDI